MKPIIGISVNSLRDISQNDVGQIGVEGQDWQLIAADYIRAVERNGGIPILIPNIETMEDMRTVLDKIDGLLLSGGHDVNPRTYNERNSGKAGKFDNIRDHEEIFMTEYALEKDIPFLGICRGLQILNVTLGGTIHQDLPSAGFPAHSMSNSLRNEPSHELKVLEDTPLFDIFKREEIWTNSYHHQGINELGRGLKKAALSEEGLIEAVYLEDKKFALAVQWHPEMMYDDKEMNMIFEKFIDACK